MWNDPDIGFKWPGLDGASEPDTSMLVLSEKDLKHPYLSSLCDRAL